jgi:fatty-acyl-CoA synthase
LLQLACPRVGVVLVNVNPAYRTADLGYIIRKSGMTAIFHFPNDARADYDAILKEVVCQNACDLRHDIRIGADSWQSMIAAGKGILDAAVDPGTVANIQYTSGTTGSPKAVMLTHRNLVNNAWFTAQGLEITEHDRICQTFPLYHCAGYTCSSLAALISGASLVLPSRMFDARATLEAVHEERVTLLYGVPSMFIAELEDTEFDRFDTSSIHAAMVGGAPCPPRRILSSSARRRSVFLCRTPR